MAFKTKSEACMCEICGLSYVIPVDRREHDQRHRQFIRLSDKYAVPRFGPLLWTYREREAHKRDCVAIEDWEDSLYAWFCRSVEAWGKFDHPEFRDYAAIMVANGLAWITPDMERQLAKLYPRRKTKRGYIKPGHSYWSDKSPHGA